MWGGLPEPWKLVSAWTIRGHDVPFLTGRPTPEHLARWRSGGSVSGAEITAATLADTTLAASISQATIPLDHFGGNVMLISAGDDHVWGSAQLARIVVAQLKSRHFPHEVISLSYPDAGHNIGAGFLPRGRRGRPGQFDPAGGSAKEDAAVANDSWPRVLRFLSLSLNRH